MKILINTIPHSEQRYNTPGDWQFYTGELNWNAARIRVEGNDSLKIRVSALGDWKMEFLLAMHETIEAALCRAAGITAEQVDTFDFNWKKTSDGPDEPGDDPTAPYHSEHVIATSIERELAAALCVNWDDYSICVDELTKTRHD